MQADAGATRGGGALGRGEPPPPSRRVHPPRRSSDGPYIALVLLLLVWIVATGVAILLARVEAKYVPHGLRDAMRRHQREAAPPTRQWESGDLVFISYTPRPRKWFLPREVRRIQNETYAHVALVLRHATHGLCLVDAFYDERPRALREGTRRGDGTLLLAPSRFSQRAPDVFQGTRVRNGSVRRRALRRGVRLDVDAAWAAVAAMNAASPPLTLGNHSGMLTRLASYAARCVTDAPLLDGLLGDEALRQASCPHTAMVLLEAGGAWAGAPHRANAVLHALAPPNTSGLYESNRGAAGLARGVAPTLANVHGLPNDLSSTSPVDTARALWDKEEFLAERGSCDVAAFL